MIARFGSATAPPSKLGTPTGGWETPSRSASASLPLLSFVHHGRGCGAYRGRFAPLLPLDQELRSVDHLDPLRSTPTLYQRRGEGGRFLLSEFLPFVHLSLRYQFSSLTSTGSSLYQGTLRSPRTPRPSLYTLPTGGGAEEEPPLSLVLSIFYTPLARLFGALISYAGPLYINLLGAPRGFRYFRVH